VRKYSHTCMLLHFSHADSHTQPLRLIGPSRLAPLSAPPLCLYCRRWCLWCATRAATTEIMWLGAGHLLQQVDICDVIPVLSSTVRVVQSTRDLGVILDSQLSLSAHIAALCRYGLYQLRQIRPAIRSLTPDAARTIVQAFIACRLDWCNSLLYGVPENLLRKVQSVRTLPFVYSSVHADVTTSHHCCASYTGCQSRDEWSLRLRVLYTSR